MTAKLRHLRNLILNSYWFVPGLMTLAAIALSLLTLRLDAGLGLERIRGWGPLSDWFYMGGVDGAREVLSTVAGSMITVAGVVFSITIVALTLASSQFGPRVLSNFMRDRGNQLVLGTFLSTFLYCLLVLRTIRSAGDDGPAIVPHLSITLGLALSLVSIGVLIFFIHHVATAIQAPNLIARVAEELHESIDHLFPEEIGHPAEEPPDSLATCAPEVFERESAPIAASRNGYIDVIDTDVLMRTATERSLLCRLEFRPGQFVVRGNALLRVWPAHQAEEMREVVRDAVVLGPRRTGIQDVEFTADQLVEVALRALSPGINDPFTAINCLDRLGAAVCHLMQRRLPSSHRLDDRGETRLVVHRPFTLAGFLDACFHQIRQNAAGQASVHIRLLEVLGEAMKCARLPAQLDLLMRHADLAVERARADVVDASGRAALEERYATLNAVACAARETLERAPRPAPPA